MKAFLIFLLAVAVSAHEFSISRELEAVNFEPIEFMKGLFEAIGETKPVGDIIKCLRDLEKILDKIEEAFELIMELRIQSITKGVKLLIEAIRELSAMIKPCITGYEVVAKLIREIYSADITKIIQKVISNSPIIITQIIEGVKCIKSQDSKCVGTSLGTILKLIYLDSSFIPMDGSDVDEFIEAFLKAIGEVGDYSKIKECLSDLKYILRDFKKAFEYIKSDDPLKIIVGITRLLEAVRNFIHSLKPCSSNLEVLQELIEAIENIQPEQFIQRFMINLMRIISTLEETYPCFDENDFGCVGNGIGIVLELLFL